MGINFTNAEAQCLAKQAILPVITSREQNDFIKAKLENSSVRKYWLNIQAPTPLCSCMDSTTEKCTQCRQSWQWRDGSPMNFLNWKSASPQAVGRQCAYMYGKSGSWDDTSCSNENPGVNIFRYVCQYSCLNGLCQNHECSLINDSYHCTCPAGYTNPHCDAEIDECASNPCVNSVRCIDLLNSYTCECHPSFSGPNCESDTICQSAPCQFGGTCARNGNIYECACIKGYTGVHCETDINECNSSPCKNGGSCYELLNGYTCNCAVGFNGTTCQENINDCLSSPCLTVTVRMVLLVDYRQKKRYADKSILRLEIQQESEESGFNNVASTSNNSNESNDQMTVLKE